MIYFFLLTVFFVKPLDKHGGGVSYNKQWINLLFFYFISYLSNNNMEDNI